MQISHVIRAEEWISSTPKHVQLYRAFDWQPPRFIHMPLLRNADKSKISKRKNPVSLDYYRDAGYLPEALLNFLGLMGFSIGGDREKFTLAEMIAEFDWAKVSAGGPVFDLTKLSWLNGHYIREMSIDQLLERLRGWRLSDDYLKKVLPLAHERMERLDQFIPNMEFFFAGDVTPKKEDMLPKGRDEKATASALSELVDKLDAVRPWTKETLEPVVRQLGEQIQWKPKELFMVVRVAMTGRTAAPGLFETMEVLGKELVRRRLREAMKAL
jgi:glutamyl-tRNA synthetase